MTRVTQSFTRQLSEGQSDRNFKAIAPVVFATAELSQAGVLGVKGSLPYYHNGEALQLDFDERWVTLTHAQVKGILDVAMADKTIETIRVISRPAGNMYGVGSEEALLIQLTGSKEAMALAKTYHLVYDETVEVGDQGVTVQTVNPIAITVKAANEVLGLLQYPTRDKAEGRPSRADLSNPTFEAALATVDATGKLPPRVLATRSNPRIDQSFAARFPQPAARTRGRQYARPSFADDI